MNNEHAACNLASFQKLFNERAEQYLLLQEHECLQLKEALLYSFRSGGKRIRPYIAHSIASFWGSGLEVNLRAGLGLEMIHTYSLVHDDLPAMDNDDYRRGVLTVHKKYNEATAILVGDALLTEAFLVFSSLSTDFALDANIVNAIVALSAEKAGFRGMVGGQSLDVNAPPKNVDDVLQIHTLKTARMMELSCAIGALLSGRKDMLSQAMAYGRSLGALFQIVDDIVDMAQDAKQDNIISLENNIALAREYKTQSLEASMGIPALVDIVNLVVNSESLKYEI